MPETNPDASQSGRDCTPVVASLASSAGIGIANSPIYRKGKLLVMSKAAALPDRCVKCNEPAEGQRVRRNLTWHDPLLYLLVVPGLLFYIILAFNMRKEATIYIGLCKNCLRRHQWRTGIAWATLIGGGALAFGGVVLIRPMGMYPWAPLAGLGVAIGLGGIILVLRAVPVWLRPSGSPTVWFG